MKQYYATKGTDATDLILFEFDSESERDNFAAQNDCEIVSELEKENIISTLSLYAETCKAKINYYINPHNTRVRAICADCVVNPF